MIMQDDWPIQCPKCKSKNIHNENKSEYTGGGYSDYWTEFWCEDCGYEWRGADQDSGKGTDHRPIQSPGRGRES